MTVISNIHSNLSAWQANHAYNILGARVSNSGNAYQVITTGTSAASGGPTTGVSDITDNTVHWKYLSHIDYTTEQAWVNAWPVTLVDDLVGRIWNNGPITTTVVSTFGVPYIVASGHTMGSFTATLTPASGEGIRDAFLSGRISSLALNTTAGVCYVLPSELGQTNYFDISDVNFIFDGIQIQDPFSGSGSTPVQYQVGASGGKIRNCNIDGFAQAGGAFILNLNDIVGIYNTLIIDRQPVSGTEIPIVFNDHGTIVNSFITALFNPPSTSAVVTNSSDVGAVTLKNSGLFGYTGITGPSNGCIVASNNVLAFASFGLQVTDNGGNKFNINPANVVVNSNTNFFLKTSSPSLNAGLILTTDIPTADDITKNPRKQGGTNWDIGPSELNRGYNFDSQTIKMFII